MLPSLCPPAKPFHPAYPGAWFMQLDAILALNGITAQPMMHAVLLQALPVELHHLSAASFSSPQPYDDFCAAVLARYGETYRPLPGTREFRISPPSTRAVPPGPQPSHDHDLPSLATTSPTSHEATSASIPAPDHPPDEVQEVPAAIGHSTETSVFSTASAHGSTTATSPHAMESAIDRDIVTPAIRPPIAEASPAMMSDEPVFPSASTLCASCQQRPASPSQFLAAEVPALNHRWPNLRDAATMTDAPEDDVPEFQHEVLVKLTVLRMVKKQHGELLHGLITRLPLRSNAAKGNAPLVSSPFSEYESLKQFDNKLTGQMKDVLVYDKDFQMYVDIDDEFVILDKAKFLIKETVQYGRSTLPHESASANVAARNNWLQRWDGASLWVAVCDRIRVAAGSSAAALVLFQASTSLFMP
ncbi:hypothetical protein HPB52_020222 [Rhipicephalus sanguineus]|uniref:Uncharacterized protein n=1 Tax=Rhipicephalus sanguineus TaxID=34632 RepID=A0A9D4PXC6_RHISA|nr:hypothetical protein HPB52_020222 [Rhipicephalus sanguineus]